MRRPSDAALDGTELVALHGKLTGSGTVGSGRSVSVVVVVVVDGDDDVDLDDPR